MKGQQLKKLREEVCHKERERFNRHKGKLRGFDRRLQGRHKRCAHARLDRFTHLSTVKIIIMNIISATYLIMCILNINIRMTLSHHKLHIIMSEKRIFDNEGYKLQPFCVIKFSVVEYCCRTKVVPERNTLLKNYHFYIYISGSVAGSAGQKKNLVTAS